MDMLTMVLLPAFAGVLIGALSGMFGIGGGTVMVPIFRLVFGMSAIASTATSLFAIIPTSISGAITHLRNKTCVFKLGLTAGLGGACTSALGVWLATISPSWLVMLAAAIIIGISAANMLRKAFVSRPVAKASSDSLASAEQSAASDPEAAVDQSLAPSPTAAAVQLPASSSAAISDQLSSSSSAVHAETYGFSLTPKNIAIGALIGMAAGVASGYVGVGGGFLMVPLMVSIFGLPMKKASGTSLIAVMILAVPGVIEQGLLGNINYLAGLILALGSIPGAILGANLIRYVPERALRATFGIFLIFAAILLVLNETATFV